MQPMHKFSIPDFVPPAQTISHAPQPAIEIPSHTPDEETRDADDDPATVGNGWIISGDIFLGVGTLLTALTLDAFGDLTGSPNEQIFKRRAMLFLSTSLGLATLGGVMRFVGIDKRDAAYLEEGYNPCRGKLGSSWILARLGGLAASLGLITSITGFVGKSKAIGVSGALITGIGLLVVAIEPAVGPRNYLPARVASLSQIQLAPYIAPDISAPMGTKMGWSAGLVGTY
jgi:hypothetical protein